MNRKYQLLSSSFVYDTRMPEFGKLIHKIQNLDTLVKFLVSLPRGLCWNIISELKVKFLYMDALTIKKIIMLYGPLQIWDITYILSGYKMLAHFWSTLTGYQFWMGPRGLCTKSICQESYSATKTLWSNRSHVAFSAHGRTDCCMGYFSGWCKWFTWQSFGILHKSYNNFHLYFFILRN